MAFSRNSRLQAAILIAIAIALYFRLPHLAARPMHCDEANHAVKAGILIESGQYQYDPADFHGPTIYYFALPVVWLTGATSLAETSETTFRIVTVAFGVALIAALLLIADGLGAWPTAIAAILTAISPAMVFYSRYYIPEIPFVFFTFIAIACAWRYSRSCRLGWLLAAGVSIGLMQASKETSVLAYGAMAAGLGTLALTRNRHAPFFATTHPSSPDAVHPGIVIYARINPWHIAGAALAAGAVCSIFITGFFSNPRALADIALTYVSYFKRADGAGLHDHPWHYYLHTLVYTKLGPGPWWSEGLIVVLAAIGIAAAFFKKTIAGANIQFVRFLAVYTIVLTVLYALIPYKTPWCMLGFLHGMILMAGIGAVVLIQTLKYRPIQAAAIAALALGMLQLAGQTQRATGRYQADTRNPYVYAHTSSDLLKLAQRFEDLAAVSPQGHNLLIKVMTPDYWPLPWYLRKFTRVGYWNQPTQEADADIVVTSTELEGQVKTLLNGPYQTEHYGLRPEVLIAVFIKQDLWQSFLATQGAPQ
jgi:uncharacterized protein (TIGR03663 family)